MRRMRPFLRGKEISTRQTIYKEDNIRTLLGVFNESPLISNGKVILGRIFEVDEIDEGGAFLAIIKVFDWHTVLQIVHYHSEIMF